MKKILFLVSVVFSGSTLADSPYDFDYKSRNDMRGAWMMCSLNGFQGGECRKVLKACWKPPMIYVSCHHLSCKTKTHCAKTPSFNMSSDDVHHAERFARSKIQ